MTLGHTTNSAECARCVAFFLLLLHEALPPFSQGRTSRRRAKKLCRHISRVALLNETFFSLSNKFTTFIEILFFYVSSNRITLITLRIFFSLTRFAKKEKKPDKVIRFIHVEQSRKWPHTTGFHHWIIYYLVIWRESFVTSSNSHKF